MTNESKPTMFLTANCVSTVSQAATMCSSEQLTLLPSTHVACSLDARSFAELLHDEVDVGIQTERGAHLGEKFTLPLIVGDIR
jgi:hypothetical protein